MNYIDIIVLSALIYSFYQGYRRGFLIGLLSLLSTAISVYLAMLLFSGVASWVSARFMLNEKIAPILSFLVLIIAFECIGNLLITLIDQHIIAYVYKLPIFAKIDRMLGTIPSALTMALLLTLLMLLPVTIPVSSVLREDIQQSWWGKNVLPIAYSYIPKIEKLANRLPTQSLLYIIPRSPSSEENVPLQFPKTLSFNVDEASEVKMLALLNNERTQRGLKPLALRESIVPVARAHSRDMFKRGYFSHVDPDGKSPFDRMTEAGITYMTAGENLAYAPTVAIAHQGLMNSPGHKANILNPQFGQVGIGVIDGGIYGKMFTQNFTD